jgi:hypothetical protein
MKQFAQTVTRRRFLLMSAATSLALANHKVRSETVHGFIKSLADPNDSGAATNQLSARAKRIAQIIEEYDSQGFHRTGTAVDRVCALWLVGRIEQLGLEAILEKFPLSRVDPIQAYIQIDKRRVEGVPLFDGTFTDVSGIKGKLGWLGTDADIAVTQISPASNTEKDKQIQAYRRSGRYKGIIAITRGGRPGLAIVNAPDFTSPFGPPVLQVSSEEAPWLEEAAKQGRDVVLVAQVQRTDVDAWNVTTTVKGKESNLAPLVVMTPRSGWWHCAGERGGGLACWLEVMRALSAKKPARDVVFVSTSGHELSELGLKFFLKQRPSLAKTARVWLHFGANIGAAVGRSSILFAATEDYQNKAIAAMSQIGAPPDERFPAGSPPLGEALQIHQRGGRYISLLGRNKLFHNPEDRWSSAVEVDTVTRLATAFANLATMLAGESDRPSASD